MKNEILELEHNKLAHEYGSRVRVEVLDYGRRQNRHGKTGKKCRKSNNIARKAHNSERMFSIQIEKERNRLIFECQKSWHKYRPKKRKRLKSLTAYIDSQLKANGLG